MRADFIVAPPVFARIGGGAIESLLARVGKPKTASRLQAERRAERQAETAAKYDIANVCRLYLTSLADSLRAQVPRLYVHSALHGHESSLDLPVSRDFAGRKITLVDPAGSFVASPVASRNSPVG
jgi:hypothetical protein